MKKAGLAAVAKRKYKVTTDSNHQLAKSPNIVKRQFADFAKAPNRLWVTDITYIPTHQGWLYLCMFLDAFSRKVVGFSVEDNMGLGMVNEALQMALRRRQITSELIIHSDQGSQYASYNFREQLAKFEISQSMSRKGDCWDNSMAESFFATLKRELINRQTWTRKDETKAAITEWIEQFYNGKRRHSAIGNMCPVQYENLTRNTQAA
ncbi:MAG: IS3 family transposase [Proteobacteria bacterium]|nr:MAG: IS3 family transposase [Pseudomonadota bacterium]